MGGGSSSANDGTLKYISFEDSHDQEECPLFQLPGEVRQSIYQHVLSSYEDNSRMYDRNTYWFRPEYSAPKRCDTTFLRTCKRVYQESWYIPWTSMVHTFWLTGGDRAPEGHMELNQFERAIDLIDSLHDDVELDVVRFFAQLVRLEQGDELSQFLNLESFHPKCVTVTLRHTDWWCWEGDEPLHIKEPWVHCCRFPESVRHVKMELESLERKKEQVDSIVEQMKENWYFTTTNEARLTARNTPVEVSRWKGSSTWGNQRWLRDETEPETLSYYVATVTWQREPEVDTSKLFQPRRLDMRVDQPQINTNRPCIHVSEIEEAEVPPGTPADKTVQLVDEYIQSKIAQHRYGPSAHMRRWAENRRLQEIARAMNP